MAKSPNNRGNPDDEFARQLEEKVKASLPQEIEHHVKVRLVFHYVTQHPLTGEDVPVEVEPRRISPR